MSNDVTPKEPRSLDEFANWTDEVESRDEQVSERAIIGQLVRFTNEGQWVLPEQDQLTKPLIVVNARRTITKWGKDKRPVETIFLKAGEKIPDLEKRNEETPKSEWVEGFDGKPKGPLRGTLRWHGGGPGRWVGLGPQLQNLDRNDLGVPLDAIELVRTGDRTRLTQYGNPLTLIGSLARGALCAAPGHEFLIFDYSSIESRVLAWLAGETLKLDAYRAFDASGDKRIEPYRIIASKMLGKDLDAISKVDRQTGKDW
jgi:hypothetical protein